MSSQASRLRPAHPPGNGLSTEFPRTRSAVRPRPVERPGAERLGRALGWFSVGLGAASLAAPRQMARLVGADGDRTDCALFRFVGVQELLVGVGILASRRPAGWLWARVAGDAAHLGLLGTMLASGPTRPDRMAAATAAVAGISALDAYAASRLTGRPTRTGTAPDGEPLTLHRSITVDRPAGELYRFWRDFRNLPRIMAHLESVEVHDERRSRWTARAPLGMSVSWEAEIVDDEADRLISWRSTGGQIETSGRVRFVPAPGGRGTEVHVELHYEPPLGAVGAWAAKLFGEEPSQQIYDALRHFKQVMEIGEVVVSDSSADGTRMAQRPAQPPETGENR
jgi:uncharacterized membrane protein